MVRAHIKGFVAALVVLVTVLFGHRGYQLYKVLVAVEQLSQVVANDQKTGHQFTVSDVLTDIAVQRVQEQIQAQKASQGK